MLWKLLALASTALVPFVVNRAASWLEGRSVPFAVIRGNWVHCGPRGYVFHARHLVECRFEPDDHFPNIDRLCFRFRYARFLLPRHWTMMVGDRAEAEAFRQALLERSGRGAGRARPMN